MEPWTLGLSLLGSVLAIIAVVITLFIWARSEATQDRREFRAIFDQARKEGQQRFEEARREERQYFEEARREERQYFAMIVNAIQQEMKDFHGRLCAIEERAKNRP